MTLSLIDIQRVAVEIAREEDPTLEVLAARNGEGAADYTEVLVTLHGRTSDPSQIVIGIARNAEESEIRSLLRNRLREHLRVLADG
jgi:hypothetical protein